MIRYDKVFRVRIGDDLELAIEKALTKWRHLHRWERPGTFYRELLKRGLRDRKHNEEAP